MSDEKQAHLFGKNVKLRLMNFEIKVIKDITPVFMVGKVLLMCPHGVLIAKKLLLLVILLSKEFYFGTLYTLFYVAHKKRALKVFFRVNVIFEVEKLKIFLLQKLH
jgi:hypothetical protein